jgi:two-component SAPR family response regulator
MLASNDIDIFLKREELLNVFYELIKQIDLQQKSENITFNIIDSFKQNYINSIIILDTISLKEIIKNNFNINNHIFIIGEPIKEISKDLVNKYINFELINTPFNFLNLINKCTNLIKQKNISLAGIEEFKNFSYSFQLNTIYTSLDSLYLTDKENEIFKLLIDNKNIPMNKKKLLSKVWNYSDSIDTHTLETHIYTLRKKIKKKLNLPDLISHKDTGYFISDKK